MAEPEMTRASARTIMWVQSNLYGYCLLEGDGIAHFNVPVKLNALSRLQDLAVARWTTSKVYPLTTARSPAMVTG
jgi:hypothetical protein